MLEARTCRILLLAIFRYIFCALDDDVFDLCALQVCFFSFVFSFGFLLMFGVCLFLGAHCIDLATNL